MATKTKTTAKPKLDFTSGWNYAPSPESTDHIKLEKRYGHFINGEFVKPATGKYFPSINPATEKVISEVGYGDARDIDKAVKAARNAYEKVWKKMPGSERGKYLYRIARIMQDGQANWNTLFPIEK
ncbi:hypothetical protein BH09BAC5_BH09BAC5_23910 [soil metagenome]